jgi:hypothetical protein
MLAIMTDPRGAGNDVTSGATMILAASGLEFL